MKEKKKSQDKTVFIYFPLFLKKILMRLIQKNKIKAFKMERVKRRWP